MLNIAYVAVSGVGGLPSALFLAHRLSSPCTLSSEELEHACLAWGCLVGITQPVVFRAFGFAWHQILSSLLLQLAVVVFFSAALPSLDFGMADRSRQKRTMADLRWIGREIENYQTRTGRLPIARSSLELSRVIGKRLPTTDGWGNPLHCSAGPAGYRIVSYGACGEPDRPPTTGVVKDPHGDLILENGRFVTYPMGFEP